MRKCPQCGFENHSDNQFCKQCGAKLSFDEKNEPMTREAARKMQSKQKRKGIYLIVAIILILILMLFGLAQATGKQSKSGSKTKEKTSLISKQMSSMTTSITSSAVNIKERQTTIQTIPNVNTKDLTTQQVNKWVYANIMINWNKNNTNEPPLTSNDQNAFIFNQRMDDQGCVEIRVQENRQSAFMKNINVIPTINQYRVNAQGYLQQRADESDNWKTIAQNYQEP